MPQTLYRFGVDPSHPTAKTTNPTAILTAAQISILWTSWCDLIYTTRDSATTGAITYRGTSLNAAQQEQLQLTFPDANTNAFSADPRYDLTFFGSPMHDGVRGYIQGHTLCIFGTRAEQAKLGNQYCECARLRIPSSLHHEVRICSDASLLVTSKPITSHKHKDEDRHDGTARVGSLEDVQRLRDYCNSTTTPQPLASFSPTQLVVNATTATAIDETGKVHTRTADPRYPSCIGRPHTGTSVFEPVPYLSETRITKIASGGYMTAAISEDGELFLWGQSNPGADTELGVLHRQDYEADAAGREETVVWCNAEQDEYVKCLNITIDGCDATAYDVAIGFGHILIAAKNNLGEHVVFAAGCGSEGQLGLGKAVEVLGEFEAVVAIRGKLVVQLEAAGWSSFVVTEDSDWR